MIIRDFDITVTFYRDNDIIIRDLDISVSFYRDNDIIIRDLDIIEKTIY